jgi:hypothetical protein
MLYSDPSPRKYAAKGKNRLALAMLPVDAKTCSPSVHHALCNLRLKQDRSWCEIEGFTLQQWLRPLGGLAHSSHERGPD